MLGLWDLKKNWLENGIRPPFMTLIYIIAFTVFHTTVELPNFYECGNVVINQSYLNECLPTGRNDNRGGSGDENSCRFQFPSSVP